MKTLDRYIIRNFLFTAMLCFAALMSLRIVVDLFVNMDEFAKQSRPRLDIVADILRYYGFQSAVYVTELGGVIIVSAAAFTLAMMNHSNELTAMLGSGVSLRRVVLPIAICSMVLGGVVIADQELLIPRIADKLVRDRDDVPGVGNFALSLVPDEMGTVWNSPSLRPDARILEQPLAIIRDADYSAIAALIAGEKDVATPAALDGVKGWMFSGGVAVRAGKETADWFVAPSTERVHSFISPQSLLEQERDNYRRLYGRDLLAELQPPAAEGFQVADEHYDMVLSVEKFLPGPLPADGEERAGMLISPRFSLRAGGRHLGTILADSACWSPMQGQRGRYCWALEGGRLFLPSDLTIEDLQLRQSSRWLDYMSSSQLTELLKLKRVPDEKAAALVKHVRVTEPINNLVMLLLGLPFILSRERNIKASAGLCLLTVATFYVFVYICRYMGLPPHLAAWLPSMLFGPIAVVMFDSVKT